MKLINSRRIAAIVSGLLPVFIALSPHAQYVWVDKKDVKNYSDWPPPASVPDKNILKSPRQLSWSERLNQEPEAAAPKENSPSQPTTAEKEAEYQKRVQERLEKQKEANEARNRALQKSKRCDKAREYKRTLDSGIRIANTNKDGKRYYMTDEQRQKEQREVSRTIAECR